MLEAPFQPRFPPLMAGEAAKGPAFEHAVLRAEAGCDAGLVAYRHAGDSVDAAMVLAPDVPLADAVVMFPLCGVGFQNALGALAPPEVAVHLSWHGDLWVNMARCGALRMTAATADPAAVPDWLVVGFTLRLSTDDARPGDRPEATTLYAEGCADVDPLHLVEAWARHSLNWINRWEDDGTRPLHAEWRGLAHGIGEPATVLGQRGTFLGVDERFGMLLRDEAGATTLIPLTALLEDAS